jgi:2-dehydropantoate 2-reductase
MEVIKMRIAIMGSGGLGSYLGGRLVQSGHDVSFITRGDHLHALVENGLEIKSNYGDFKVEKVIATDDPEKVGEVNVIFFCVKSYDSSTAARLMKPMVGKESVIIPVQNGLDHIDILRAVLDPEHVLGGIAMIVAHLREPGIIEQIGPVHFLEFGEISGGISDRCSLLEKRLLGTSIDFKASKNIMERMWWKLCIVSGFAGVYSVVRGNNAVVSSSPETLSLLRGSISEAISVAQVSGIDLPLELVEEILAEHENTPSHYKPSMLVDLENGKPLELEAIIGVIARLGKAYNVPTPINSYLYACLKPYVNGSPIT